MNGFKRPRIKDISATLLNHYRYYSDVRAETCEQQLSNEREISQQYSGRAVFELVQNAFDHCEKRVMVILKEDDQGCKLIVANDGRPLSVDPHYDYDAWNLNRERKRSDFHALCSLSTSNKSPDESIGHKGIGFKSVFSIADNVQIWSRAAELGNNSWWGIEFHKKMSSQLVQNRINKSEVKKGVKNLLNNDYSLFPDNHRKLIYPSFYYPLPLWSDNNFIDIPDSKNILTVVIVPVDINRKPDVVGSIKELKRSHLFFVGIRKPEVKVLLKTNENPPVNLSTSMAQENMSFNCLAVWPCQKDPKSKAKKILKEMSEAIQLDISNPGVAVFWGEKHRRKVCDGKQSNFLYCYLPTRMEAAFNVDYNGDFQIGIDRTTINIDENNEIGQYNRALIEAATEVHLAMVLYALGFSDRKVKKWTEWKWLKSNARFNIEFLLSKPKPDMFSWKLLYPAAETLSQKVSVEHMKKLLFIDHNNCVYYSKWAELSRIFFNKKRRIPLNSFKDFWDASAKWLVYIFPYYNRGTKNWKVKASYMCDSLRKEEVKVVPIIEEFIEADDDFTHEVLISKSIMLPDRREKGASLDRANVRVFLRKETEGEAASIQLPQAVLDRGRAITTYSFPHGLDDSPPRPTGVVDLERWTLLQELQQLPTSVKDYSAKSGQYISRKHQYEILKFAAQLYVAGFGTHKSLQDQSVYSKPGWRVDLNESEEARAAGRALATLFLPTSDNLWEPARQLTIERIARRWKNKILKEVPGLDVDKFLIFLGVSPQEKGLLLVEGGEDGLVKAFDIIPPLVEPSPSVRIPPIKPVFSKSDKAEVQVVKEAWSWLSDLVYLENQVAGEEEKKTRTRICETLGEKKWFPVAGDYDHNVYANAPCGIVNIPTHIEPKRIVIQPDRGDLRRFQVLWRVKRSSPYSEILTALGAKKGLDKAFLEDDDAIIALELLNQLKELDLGRLKSNYQARQGLIELYKYLFEIIINGGNSENINSFSMLIYKGSSLRNNAQKNKPLIERNLVWDDNSKQEWYLTRNNDQQELIRRFYPELDLAVAVAGPKKISNVKWLKNRSILLKRQISYRPDEVVGEGGQIVKETIKPLLPGLLALTQASRLYQEEVNVMEVKKRWDGLKFISCSNVWEEISTDQPKLNSQQWLKDIQNVVLFYTRDERDLFKDSENGHHNKEDLLIYFDKARSDQSFPPLRYFARALAEKLLNNLSLEGLFAQALTEYQDGGEKFFQEYLEKNGVWELARTFQQRLNPLTEKQEEYFKKNLISALENVDCRLDAEREKDGFLELRYLRTADIRPAKLKREKLCEEDINKSFSELNFQADGIDYTPQFDCYSENLQKWESWLELNNHKDRLLYAVLGEDLFNNAYGMLKTKKLDELKDYVYSKLQYYAFLPEKVAKEWLLKENPSLAPEAKTKDLEKLLPLIPRISPVKSILSGKWSPVELADEPEKYPLEPGKGNLDNKIILGREAEEALCELIVSQTLEILNKDETAWDKLVKFTNEGWRVREELEKARADIDHLKGALHVSEYWGNAGFDIIGLEEDVNNKTIKVVLYEVKAITGDNESRLHISRNQLKTFDEYNSKEKPIDDVCWKLVGVESKGRAEDLTSHIHWLLCHLRSDAFLKKLHDHGFKPEGFTLTIKKQKGSNTSSKS